MKREIEFSHVFADITHVLLRVCVSYITMTSLSSIT